MIKKFLVASLFFAIANSAFAINSKYQFNYDGELPIHISSVVVQASEKVAAETDLYDKRDVNMLKDVLYKKVFTRLSEKGLINQDGVKLVLTMTELKANRPTQAMYRSRPGIDFSSIALGGASLTGKMIAADGSEVGSLNFTWEESWIDQVQGASIWYDARWAFDRFSRRIIRDLDPKPQS